MPLEKNRIRLAQICNFKLIHQYKISDQTKKSNNNKRKNKNNRCKTKANEKEKKEYVLCFISAKKIITK